MNVNPNFLVENVIEIKSRVTINVHLGGKIHESIMCANITIFGILVHVLEKIVNSKIVIVK